MATTTMSVRVSEEMRRWLERFSKGRGSGGGSAALLLEEARRRELFPAIDFRDTPLGRLAYVHGTRVPVALVLRMGRGLTSVQTAEHYGWPLWKAESALAYARAYTDEMVADESAWGEAEGELALRIPGIQMVES